MASEIMVHGRGFSGLAQLLQWHDAIEASVRARRRQDSVRFVLSPLRLAPAWAFALGLTLAGHLAAQTEDCQAPRLHVDLPPSSPWAKRIGPLRAELRDLRLDRCAQVDIRLQGADVVISVTSLGRSASRRLSEPSELVRTVEALMVLPPAQEPAGPASPSERVPDEAERPVTPPEPTHVEI